MTHVLIVEDHEAERTLLRKRLEHKGYRITTAGNGLEALDAARRDPPDAIVSDVLMPKMDGFALCRAWMQDAALRGIPFIFYSATYLRREDKRFGLALGAVRYLIKPLDEAVFLEELRAVLQQRAGHAAPAPALPLNDAEAQVLHESALARKIEDKVAQLEAANRKLQESEAHYRQLFEANPHPMWFFDPETLAFLAVNDAAVAHYGWSREEFLAMTLADIRPAETRSALLKHLATDNEKHIRTVDSSEHRKKDGTLIDVEISSHIVDFGGRRARIASAYDITDRKRAEDALARESRRNLVFLRNASDGIHILDSDGNVLEVSDSFCKMLGYSREELIGANVSLWDAQWSPQELKQLIAKQIANTELSVLETRHRRRDGSFVDVEVTGQGLELDGKPVLFNSARDITKRVLAGRELVESEARFRGLVEQTIAGIYIIQDGKLAYVNPRAAEIVGQGSTDKLIGTDPLGWITEADRGTVAENLRRLVDGEADSLALDFGVLRQDGVVIQVGANAARATYKGRPAIIGLLQDISEKKRADAEIRRYLEQLKTAFMSTVKVATTLSEMRDPYTAGHERRVAQIAVAIGAELGFDERRQEGLQVAGYLHDVGKMTIPAEILSKPGKLSAIELQLIQGHAQAGYDVLKGVEFPWPVAQVALQHHERMDGSGYPQGLEGEAILLEARIMAVADVVEAMSSFRPYRPGLGINKALAEIERGRGSLYDPVVTDACLRLFREKGYAIPG
jgi:PAS domain S-box-containing protein